MGSTGPGSGIVTLNASMFVPAYPNAEEITAALQRVCGIHGSCVFRFGGDIVGTRRPFLSKCCQMHITCRTHGFQQRRASPTSKGVWRALCTNTSSRLLSNSSQVNQALQRPQFVAVRYCPNTINFCCFRILFRLNRHDPTVCRPVLTRFKRMYMGSRVGRCPYLGNRKVISVGTLRGRLRYHVLHLPSLRRAWASSANRRSIQSRHGLCNSPFGTAPNECRLNWSEIGV